MVCLLIRLKYQVLSVTNSSLVSALLAVLEFSAHCGIFLFTAFLLYYSTGNAKPVIRDQRISRLLSSLILLFLIFLGHGCIGLLLFWWRVLILLHLLYYKRFRCRPTSSILSFIQSFYLGFSFYFNHQMSFSFQNISL